MKPKVFKLALVQMQVKGGDKAWNIRHGVELISEAAYEWRRCGPSSRVYGSGLDASFQPDDGGRDP